VIHLEHTTAADMVEVAQALLGQDPSWRTETFELADGQAVLFGRGLYVNRVLGAGLVTDISDSDLTILQERSRAVGVPPAIEVSEYSLESFTPQLRAHGFDAGSGTAVMVRPLNDDLPKVGSSIEVQAVGHDGLATWQEATAEGWGHIEAQARRASDAFAAAASEALTPGLLLARSADEGRVLGCASLSLRDGVATLGGMSTLPAERGHSVQGTLISHRLRLAVEAGCTIALTEVRPDSQSQRNLMRYGFKLSHTKTTWTLGRR